MKKILNKITKVIPFSKNNIDEKKIKSVFIAAQQIIDKNCITQDKTKEMLKL